MKGKEHDVIAILKAQGRVESICIDVNDCWLSSVRKKLFDISYGNIDEQLDSKFIVSFYLVN
jgi:hypothetical protein